MKKLDPSVNCRNFHCIRHETNQEIKKIIDIYKNKDLVEGKVLPKNNLFI